MSALYESQPQGKMLYIYGVEIKNKYFGRCFIRFNRHLNCLVGEKESGKSYIFQLMQKAVVPAYAQTEGEVKLFVEKINDSTSSYYAFCNEKEKDSSEIYSIDKEKNLAAKVITESPDELMIMPNFYYADGIEKLISSTEELNAFLIKHFGKPTKQNLDRFNKMFSIANFLEEGEDRLFFAQEDKGGYKVNFNVNWHSGKEKMTDFFKLSNSLRRIAVISMIVVSGSFGPLIIDAPEDNFDNKDISRFLVPILEKYKEKRQIILFTNNPILLVNSDPENYILLNPKGNKPVSVESGFSIDEKDRKECLINLIEGGINSFKTRTVRYGI